MVQSPSDFDGSLADLFGEFIEPNLPLPACVADLHRQLVQYATAPDPLFLLRHIRGTERRMEYATRDGTRFKATDNAPAWWTQYAVLQGYSISPEHVADVMRTIPVHMFDVPKALPTTANAAGWHIAHIFPVKDGDTGFRDWTRGDVMARFIRNVHPCNYFLVPKTDWQRWGGDERVISFFAELHSRRYADVWSEFLALSKGRMPPSTEKTASTRITFGQGGGMRKEGVPLPSDISPASDGSDVSYSASRLTFKAKVIEPLAEDDAFRVVTPSGTFQFTKAGFYRAFPGVVSSASYREKGLYNFPSVPRAALPFLVERKD